MHSKSTKVLGNVMWVVYILNETWIMDRSLLRATDIPKCILIEHIKDIALV
jgi:hypothetical protein